MLPGRLVDKREGICEPKISGVTFDFVWLVKTCDQIKQRTRNKFKATSKFSSLRSMRHQLHLACSPNFVQKPQLLWKDPRSSAGKDFAVNPLLDPPHTTLPEILNWCIPSRSKRAPYLVSFWCSSLHLSQYMNFICGSSRVHPSERSPF